MPVAEHGHGIDAALGLGGGEFPGVETGEGAQPVGRVEIDDQHVGDAVGPRLQLETARLFELAPRRQVSAAASPSSRAIGAG